MMESDIEAWIHKYKEKYNFFRGEREERHVYQERNHQTEINIWQA